MHHARRTSLECLQRVCAPVSGVSEATCDSLAWWDAFWQERDAHHRNWNGGTYVGAYRPLVGSGLFARCRL